MARSQNSFIKRQKEKKKQEKKEEKQKKKEERQKNSVKGGSLDDMIAYLDEEGNIISKEEMEKKDESK